MLADHSYERKTSVRLRTHRKICQANLHNRLGSSRWVTTVSIANGTREAKKTHWSNKASKRDCTLTYRVGQAYKVWRRHYEMASIPPSSNATTAQLTVVEQNGNRRIYKCDRAEPKSPVFIESLLGFHIERRKRATHVLRVSSTMTRKFPLSFGLANAL